MKTFTSFLIILLSAVSLNLRAQNQIENPGFEEWEAITNEFEEPVNWSTVKTCVPENLAGFAPITVDKNSTNPHSGDYCIHVYTVKTPFGIIATGNATNGRVHANTDPDKGYIFIDVNDDRWNTKIDMRPDSLTGWFRANPMPGDHGVVKLLLATDSASLPSTDSLNWVGFANFDLPGDTVNEWTRFSVPFTYYNEKTPKYFLCVITSSIGVSATEGSELWVDDLSIVKATGINEISVNDVNIYYTGTSLNIFIEDTKTQKARIKMLDLKGTTVFESIIKTGQKTRFDINVSNGIYIVMIKTGDKMISKKVLINK